MTARLRPALSSAAQYALAPVSFVSRASSSSDGASPAPVPLSVSSSSLSGPSHAGTPRALRLVDTAVLRDAHAPPPARRGGPLDPGEDGFLPQIRHVSLASSRVPTHGLLPGPPPLDADPYAPPLRSRRAPPPPRAGMFLAESLNTRGTASSRKSLAAILSLARASNTQVLALQEIGDLSPVDLRDSAAVYGFFSVCSPLPHAGVALLVPLAWKDRMLRTGSVVEGRDVWAAFEIGASTAWYASIYLPTNLDYEPRDSDHLNAVSATLHSLIKSSAPYKTAMFLGDFNCTSELTDRARPLARPAPASALHSVLELAGFLDVARHLIPVRTPFTYTGPASDHRAAARSRLDFIYVRGLPRDRLLSFTVSSVPRCDHKRLSLGLNLHVSVPKAATHVSVRVPDLRRATEEQCNNFVQAVDTSLLTNQPSLLSRCAGSPEAISDVIEEISSFAREAAAVHLPWTGGKQDVAARYRTLDERLRLLRQLRKAALAAGRHCFATTVHDPRRQVFLRCLNRCRPHHTLLLPPTDEPGWHEWLLQLDGLIASALRARQRIARRSRKRPSPSSHAAFCHRILRDVDDDGVTSVVDPTTGKLVSSPAEVKAVLHEEFRVRFHVDTDQREQPPLPEWAEELYRAKPVPAGAYDSLMADFSPAEVAALLKESRNIVAPGADLVGAGLLRLVSATCPSLSLVLAHAFSACLRVMKMPRSGKLSIICPILKSASGPNLRALSNLRPISLQPAIAKLLTKGLARRLGRIFATHRILHEAQEAFLPGRSSFACVDALLDVWERAASSSSCFNLFYDISRAYDTVRVDDLVRAMERLSLPPGFIAFVVDSMTDCFAVVRTPYGNTLSFPLLRSVRQGCPLAPLLFIILMDPWHCGLEVNPLFGGTRDGFVYSPSRCIASKGYADDTWACSSSLAGLWRMNRFTVAFCTLNHLQLNALKTQMTGKNADGSDMVNSGTFQVKIDGAAICVTACNVSLRYIGVWVCMALSWSDQVQRLNWRVHSFCRTAIRHRLPTPVAVYLFNVFLLAKLEHVLRHCVVPRSTLRGWDKALVRTISRLSGALHFRFQTYAFAYLADLTLPSELYPALRVSELFFRLNGGNHCAALSALRAADVRSPLKFNRFAAVQNLASKSFGLSFSPSPLHGWVLPAPGASSAPPFGALQRSVVLADSINATLAFGHLGPWGHGLPAATVSVLALVAQTAEDMAWSITFEPFSASPSSFSSRSSMADRHTATVEAVTTAAFACPITWSVRFILVDASVCKAVDRFLSASSWRQRLRTNARPLLTLLSRLQQERAQYNSTLSFSAVKQDLLPPQSLSAPWLEACQALRKPADPRLRLNWFTGEAAFALHSGAVASNSTVLMQDPRRALLLQLKNSRLSLWQASHSQSLFAGDYSRDLYRAVAANGSSKELALCARICTNTIHRVSPRNESGLSILTCPFDSCAASAPHSSVVHRLQCREPSELASRASLKNEVLTLLSNSSASGRLWHRNLRWSAVVADLPLSCILRRLLDPHQRSTGVVDYRFLFGAWTRTEQASAARLTACSTAVWDQLRLLLFRSVASSCLRAFSKAGIPAFPRY